MSLFVMPYRACGVPFAVAGFPGERTQAIPVVPGERASAGEGAVLAAGSRDQDPAAAARHRARVRPVRRADSESWAALRRACWPDAPAGELHLDIERWWWIGDSCTQCFVAEERRRLVGFIELSVRTSAEGYDGGRVAHVGGWYVAPDARGRGIGRALMRAAEAWAQEKNCSELGAESDLLDHAAQRAQAALGFTAVATIVRFHKMIESSRQPGESEANPFHPIPPGAR